jgi:hypothetical protein
MSKLLIMPVEAAAASIPSINIDKIDMDQVDLIGHLLMLNMDIASHFSCGGFQVSRRYPTHTITPQTQMGPVRQALKAGKLIDITGTDIRGGIKTKHGEASALQVTDTGKRAYIGQDGKGNTFVIAPKTKKEQKRIEKLIKTTGTVPGEYILHSENHSGFSGIKVEDIVPEKPRRGKKSLVLCDASGKEVGRKEIKTRRKPKKKKAVKNARTHRSKRFARRERD